MREILFRGKDILTGEWLYGDLIQSANEEDAKFIVPFTETNTRGIISETIGQFTGLCDKNGKKIFEGDIVKAVGSTLTAVVQYFPEEGAFMLYCKERHFVDYLGTIEMSKIEIIGNVFDNPELLKDGDKAE